MPKKKKATTEADETIADFVAEEILRREMQGDDEHLFDYLNIPERQKFMRTPEFRGHLEEQSFNLPSQRQREPRRSTEYTPIYGQQISDDIASLTDRDFIHPDFVGPPAPYQYRGDELDLAYPVRVPPKRDPMDAYSSWQGTAGPEAVYPRRATPEEKIPSSQMAPFFPPRGDPPYRISNPPGAGWELERRRLGAPDAYRGIGSDTRGYLPEKKAAMSYARELSGREHSQEYLSPEHARGVLHDKILKILAEKKTKKKSGKKKSGKKKGKK